MTTIKTLPIAVNRAAVINQDIVLNSCCWDELRHPDPMLCNKMEKELEEACIIKGIGLNSPFIYKISCFDTKIPFFEIGIAKIALKDSQHILERDKTLIKFNEDIGIIPTSDENYIETFDDGLKISVEVYHGADRTVPNLDHSLAYDGGFVLLDKEGLIFSKDGHINIISPSELVKFISRSSATLSVGPLHTTPTKSRPKKPKKGTIIFNELAECFEGYDGTSWKKISWEDK